MVDIVEKLRNQHANGLVSLKTMDEYVSYGDAAEEIERLREALQETIKVMVRAHDRTHVLPRTSDTELARSIELSIKRARTVLGEDKY